MTDSLPTASIRSRVALPMRFLDGFETTADLIAFDGLIDSKEHVALGLGKFDRHSPDAPPLVRMHSECLTGDVFGSQRCDCGAQLRESVETIVPVGGYVLYLRQEGRGIGLYDKIDTYVLQDRGLDTFAANRAIGRGNDERNYAVAAQMLNALGAARIDLLSNNPDKARQLRRFGVEVHHEIPTGVHVSAANHAYLTAKVALGDHRMIIPDR